MGAHARQKRSRIEVDALKQTACGQWDRILRALGPETLQRAVDRAPRHVPCPRHAPSKDGFRVFKDYQATGGGICNTCGPFADGLALLQWVNDWGFRETLEAVAGELGMSHDHRLSAPPPRRGSKRASAGPTERAEAAKRRRRLRKIWREAVALDAPGARVARRYLRARGIPWPVVEPVHEQLRYHPRVKWIGRNGELAYFPAMLACVRSPGGRPVTVHRTYLSPTGTAKAPLPAGQPTKKLMPSAVASRISGSAIRLGGARRVMGVAEGIETALSVLAATGMTTWPTVSDTMLGYWQPATEAALVAIWADKDANGAGTRWAFKLKHRLVRLGYTAVILTPPGPLEASSRDWNDVWNERGVRGFQPAMSAVRLAWRQRKESR